MKMKKADIRAFCLVVFPLEIFAFICQFFANTQWQEANANAGIGWNLLGGAGYLASMVSVFFTWKWVGLNKSHPGMWIWFGGMAVGMLTSLAGYGPIF